MAIDKRLYATFPTNLGPNGDLADPDEIRVGRAFETHWAFVDEMPAYYVYQVFARNQKLIYVGITDWFPARWSAHLRSSWWATSVEISCVMLAGYRSKFEARVIEALLIDENRPPCNVKPERKYLRIARAIDRPLDVVMAELWPVRKF